MSMQKFNKAEEYHVLTPDEHEKIDTALANFKQSSVSDLSDDEKAELRDALNLDS